MRSEIKHSRCPSAPSSFRQTVSADEFDQPASRFIEHKHMPVRSCAGPWVAFDRRSRRDRKRPRIALGGDIQLDLRQALTRARHCIRNARVRTTPTPRTEIRVKPQVRSNGSYVVVGPGRHRQIAHRRVPDVVFWKHRAAADAWPRCHHRQRTPQRRQQAIPQNGTHDGAQTRASCSARGRKTETAKRATIAGATCRNPADARSGP